MLDGMPFHEANEMFPSLTVKARPQEAYFPSCLDNEKPEIPMTYQFVDGKFSKIPKEKTGIRYYNFYAYDNQMHKKGAADSETIALMERIVESTASKDNWIIMSDHGHYPVHTNINPFDVFSAREYFIGSMMIRAWGNVKIRDHIGVMINDNPEIGTIDRSIAGDIWLECLPGFAFMGDRFTGKPYKSQHGYSMKSPMLQGFIASSEGLNPPTETGELIEWIRRMA